MNMIRGLSRLCDFREKNQVERQNRKEFIARLKREVAELRKGYAMENHAVRVIWFGPTAAEKAAEAARLALVAERIRQETEAARLRVVAEVAEAERVKADIERIQMAARIKAAADAAESARVRREVEALKVSAIEADMAKKTAGMAAANREERSGEAVPILPTEAKTLKKSLAAAYVKAVEEASHPADSTSAKESRKKISIKKGTPDSQ